MKSLAEAKMKRARAVELLAEGKTYDEVAQLAGYRHRGSAHRAVFQALADHEVEGVAKLRALEAARLDQLQVAIWDKAMTGDVGAVASTLRIMEQRQRLLGLKSHPQVGGHQNRPAYLVNAT